MNYAIPIFVCVMVVAATQAGTTTKGNRGPVRYWFGDPPKAMSQKEVYEAYPRCALATLDPKERAAFDKLKDVGFFQSKSLGLQFDQKDGKRIVVLPKGIELASPRIRPGSGKQSGPTQADLAWLAHLRHVVYCELEGDYVDDDTLDLLRNMEEMRTLALSVTAVTDQGLKKLARLKSLSMVRIHSPNITDNGVESLAALPALTALSLQRVCVTDRGIAKLAGAKNLEALNVSVAYATPRGVNPERVGDKGVAALTALNKLKELTLNECRLTDDGLANMSAPGKLKNLFRLGFESAFVRDSGLQKLQDPTALPALKFLNLGRTKASRESIVALQLARPSLLITARFADGSIYNTPAEARQSGR